MNLNLRKKSPKNRLVIDSYLQNEGIVLNNIYDAESVRNSISAMKLNSVMPVSNYTQAFNVSNPGKETGGVLMIPSGIYSLNAKIIKDRINNILMSRWNDVLNNYKNDFAEDDKSQTSKVFDVGKGFNGNYRQYTEDSISIYFPNLSSTSLILLSCEIYKDIKPEISMEIKPEQILLRDFNETKIFLISNEEIRY